MINKQKVLMESGEICFHTQDLALLWNVTNRNTLRTVISRYIKRGILHSIYRGFYSVHPIEKIDSWELAVKAVRGFAYISCETILAKHGYINSVPNQISVLGGVSKQIKAKKINIRVRQLAPKYLLNNIGHLTDNRYVIASLDRAIADQLYFNPKFHFDRSVDWERVARIQELCGYPKVDRK